MHSIQLEKSRTATSDRSRCCCCRCCCRVRSRLLDNTSLPLASVKDDASNRGIEPSERVQSGGEALNARILARFFAYIDAGARSRSVGCAIVVVDGGSRGKGHH